MSTIKIHDKEFKPYINQERLEQRIKELAREISEDFAGKKPLFLGILNGSFIFASELFQRISIEAEISFVKLASYAGTSSTGKVMTAIGLEETVLDRDVIIIEDIVDTGRTLASFIPTLQQQGPSSISLVSLLSKPNARTHDVTINYLGFEIPNDFVVGYGLDYDGLGRNIPELYTLC